MSSSAAADAGTEVAPSPPPPQRRGPPQKLSKMDMLKRRMKEDPAVFGCACARAPAGERERAKRGEHERARERKGAAHEISRTARTHA